MNPRRRATAASVALVLALTATCSGEADPRRDDGDVAAWIGADAARRVETAARADGTWHDPWSSVATVSVREAKLDTASPQEWVAEVSLYIAEGCSELRLLVYGVSEGAPAFLASHTSHGEYQEHGGFSEIVDLDGDGLDELLVVGDTEGSFARSDLRVFEWSGEMLADRVRGADPGIGYTRVREAGAGGDTVLALDRVGYDDAVRVRALRRDELGLWSLAEIEDDGVALLRLALEQALADDRPVRSGVELALLGTALRERAGPSGNCPALQEGLERRFRRDGSYWTTELLPIMAWCSGDGVSPFMRGLVLDREATERVRVEAAKELVRLTGRRALPTLDEVFRAELGSPLEERATALLAEAARLAASLGDTGPLDLAREALADPTASEEERIALAAKVLGCCLDHTAADLLGIARGDASPELRRRAALALAPFDQVARGVPIEELVAALESPDAAVRGAIARVLRKRDARTAVPALVDGAIRERSPEALWDLVISIDALAGEVPPEVARRVGELPCTHRRGSLRAWSGMTDAEVRAALSPGGCDHERGLARRLAAERGLAEAALSPAAAPAGADRGGGAVDALASGDALVARSSAREVLVSDASVHDRARAARELGRLGERESWDVLLVALDDSSPAVRAGAADGLASVDAARADAEIASRIEAGVSYADWELVRVAGERGGSDCRRALVEALDPAWGALPPPEPAGSRGSSEDNAPFWHLEYVATALAVLDDRRGRETLWRMLGSRHPGWVRARAATALAELGPIEGAERERMASYLDDSDRRVRIAAQAALDGVDPDDLS